MSGRSARSNTWRFSIPVAHLGSSDEPQWPHAHASCRTVRSGSATCSKVPPSWPVWPPLALPERPRRLPGMRGFFFNPSLEGGLELFELSCPNWRRRSATSASSAAIRSLKRRNPPLQRGDQLFDFGRENHPTLDSDSPPVVSANPPTKLLSTIPVTFRTHPAWELRKKNKSTEFGRRGGQRHFPCLSLGQGPIHFAPKRHVQPRSSGLSPTPKTN